MAIGDEYREKIENILFRMFMGDFVSNSIDLTRQCGYDMVFDLISPPLKEIFDENKKGLERFGIIVIGISRIENNGNYAVFCDIDIDKLSQSSV